MTPEELAQVDQLAADLASDMLSFLATQYEHAATEQEKLDIILRYHAVMRDLQRTVNKAARARYRRGYGRVETKNSR